MNWIEKNPKMFIFGVMVFGGIIGITVANWMEDGDWIVGLFVGVFTPLIIALFIAGIVVDFRWPSPRNRG